MRLKQLLGILLPLVLAIATAASESQLTQVDIGTKANVTTLTLHATGAFTHSEYRPTENLMLVDLAGVSAATMDDRTQTVNLPGVVSYRVVGYKTGDGANVARLELSLTPGATVGVRQNSNDLVLRVSGSSAKLAHAEAQPASSQKVSRRSPTATVQRVNVVRGRNSIDVEILATGLLQPKALRLSQPERLVVDLPNAVPLLRQHTIPVNAAEVKMVRMSRYQSQPPVTRIVVDLGSAREWDLVPAGKKLTVKLHGAAKTSPAAASQPTGKPALETAAQEMAEETKLADTKAQELVIVQPKYHQMPATGSTPAPQSAQTQPAQAQPAQPKPAERAGLAAAKFSPSSPNPELALSPTSASLKPQVGNNLNFHQQVGPQATAPTPVARPKYTGEPISVNLKDVDLKDFFRLIHEISGLNVVLDPNVRGTLTIVLDDVPWDQALDIVLKNNGLDRQLEGNVLRIATVETLRKEADARRAQLEAQALAVEKVTVTRFLSYAHAKDVVPTVKKFLSQRGDVVSDDRTNALIIDDIPASIPRIDELLGKLDRKTQEVEIEARVVAATRSFARDIGTQVAFGYGTSTKPHSFGGSTQAGTSELLTAPGNFFVVGDPTTGDPLPIPLFSNLAATGATSGAFYNFTQQNFRLDFILTMAESRGLLKILSRPRVVTQNNIQALVRQGVRIPIVTQAQLGGPPTVTYVDAFLRLTVTPQITIEGTIFLNVDVENTVPDFGRTIQGNPTLITQQATTQVLVTDGGTVVIGGVIQTQNSVNVRQVPLLGNIPILGNLFKNRVVSTSTQELIFFITPKIIQT